MTLKVLHITAHLGGGVGRVLSSITKYSIESNSPYEHTIVCLEEPIKIQYIQKLIDCKSKVIIKPSISSLNQLIEKFDIVQIEWWNHPTTIKYLNEITSAPIRFITWYHNSGINTDIPKKLILNSHIFLFTTEASYENREIKNLIPDYENRLGAVYASGGFEEFPKPRNRTKEDISIGYFGSIKFSRMHPIYSQYISQVSTIIPNVEIKIIGDLSSMENIHTMKTLISQCKKSTVRLTFTGFVQNPILELDKLNVLAYLLNPNHYGTTENSLLQAMSMGIVPIAINNPAERYLIDNHKTGFLVDCISDFKTIIQWLHNNPEERQIIGERAANVVRERFSVENTYNQLNNYYNKVMEFDKRNINFKEIIN